MTEQFINNAISSLANNISAFQTNITVANASSFPLLGNFRIVVQSFDVTTQKTTSASEIMLVTAVTGKQFTVTRGAESSLGGGVAIAFASGAQVAHILTAAVMKSFGSGGVSSLNALTGALNLTSTGNTITITPSGTSINLESVSSGSGTVTSVSVTTANGVSGSVANATTTPAISLTLGNITPTSVTATGTLSGSNLSGTNTGDQTSVTGNAGTATKWQTPRLLAGNSVDGSANVPFANKFIVQGTADTGLSAAQFTGALGTGIVKNTTSTGILSIAVAADFPTLNQNTSGNAATVTTNANLTGAVTSAGNATSLGSFTSANLSGALTDETGSGSAVFATSPTLVTPALGTPASGALTNCTGTAAGLTAGAVSTISGLITQGTNITITGSGTSGSPYSIASSSSSGTTINTLQIDQNPAAGTYGTLAGTINGSNAVFTVSNSAYVSGSLMVFLNGQDQTQGSSNDWTETSPAAGTFTFAVAPPTGSIVQVAYIKTANTAGTGNAPVLLASVSGINAKTVANTSLYTVPTSKTAIITAAIVRCTAATAITNGPTLSMGRNSASFNDIFASTAINALTNAGPGAGSMFGFSTIGMSALAAATDVVSVAITNASTGTSQTIAIDLIGYLV